MYQYRNVASHTAAAAIRATTASKWRAATSWIRSTAANPSSRLPSATALTWYGPYPERSTEAPKSDAARPAASPAAKKGSHTSAGPTAKIERRIPVRVGTARSSRAMSP